VAVEGQLERQQDVSLHPLSCENQVNLVSVPEGSEIQELTMEYELSVDAL